MVINNNISPIFLDTFRLSLWRLGLFRGLLFMLVKYIDPAFKNYTGL